MRSVESSLGVIKESLRVGEVSRRGRKDAAALEV